MTTVKRKAKHSTWLVNPRFRTENVWALTFKRKVKKDSYRADMVTFYVDAKTAEWALQMGEERFVELIGERNRKAWELERLEQQ